MAKSKTSLSASSKAFDPTLDALFASSSGPVQKPPTKRYQEPLPPRESKPTNGHGTNDDSDEDSGEEQDDEELSELEDEELDDSDHDEDDEAENEEESDSEEAEEQPVSQKQERKRKRRDEHDDLESKYLQKLAGEVEDPDDSSSKKRKKTDAEESGSGDVEPEQAEEEESEDEAPIIHESLLPKNDEDHVDVEIDKANRTLFLGNVSTETISSATAKKQLMAHLASPLADLDSATGPHKVESLRFRSVAFSAGAMPKRAAYITKSIMTATTKSANAYVVYSTPLAARTALKALNGTVVLDRHMRVDSVAHPSEINHRRCVFVGNLGFVDDETVLNTNADGETTSKKRHKTPGDVEEGLWRIFGQHAGQVESVRVPRDPKTRVGKGFAYVQFRDGNHVEAALLLDGKKFPPMLPRALRVSRAKDPRKTAMAVERSAKARLASSDGKAKSSGTTKYQHKATPEQQSHAGRAQRLLGRAGAAKAAAELRGKQPRERRERGAGGGGGGEGAGAGADGLQRPLKTPEQFVFEGRRASSRDAKPRDLKIGKGKKKGGNPGKKMGGGVTKSKLKSRGAKRAAEWRQRPTKK